MTADYSREYGVDGPQFTTLECEKRRSLVGWKILLTGPSFEDAVMCELLGSCPLAPEATNCAAPDTGNMHVIARFGNAEQRQKWLVPLMNGEIRSALWVSQPRSPFALANRSRAAP